MYAALWRRLPGPLAFRLVTALLLAAVTVVVLFAWVFPWVSQRLPIDDTWAVDRPVGLAPVERGG